MTELIVAICVLVVACWAIQNWQFLLGLSILAGMIFVWNIEPASEPSAWVPPDKPMYERQSR